MTPNRMTTVINTSDITSTMSKASNMNLKAIMALNKNIARLCELLENGARFTDDMPVKKGKRVEKRTRKKKDPNAPKRPNTAHCLYIKKMVELLNKKHGATKKGDEGFLNFKTGMEDKTIMAGWKNADNKVKKWAIAENAKLMKEYKKELAQYEATKPAVEAVSDTDSETEEPVKKRGRPKKKVTIKEPEVDGVDLLQQSAPEMEEELIVEEEATPPAGYKKFAYMGTQEEYNDVTLYKNGDDTVIDAEFAVIGKFDEASGLIGQDKKEADELEEDEFPEIELSENEDEFDFE